MPDKDSSSHQIAHFTSVDKLLKILASGTVRFSPIENTNDPRETLAPSVEYTFTKKTGNLTFFNLFDAWVHVERKKFKLLCFSMDDLYPPFRKPRMWSQYGGDHSGCCLVFDKTRFDDYLDQLGMRVIRGRVKYQSSDLVTTALEPKNAEPMPTYFSRNIRYFCFTKNKDWENEREYRYLVESDEDVNVSLWASLAEIYVSYKVDDLLFEKILEVASPHAVVKTVRWKNGFAELDKEYSSYEDYLLEGLGESLRRILEIDVLEDSSSWNKPLNELINRYRSIPYPTPEIKRFIDPILLEYERLLQSKDLTGLVLAKRNWPIAVERHRDRMIELYDQMGHE